MWINIEILEDLSNLLVLNIMLKVSIVLPVVKRYTQTIVKGGSTIAFGDKMWVDMHKLSTHKFANILLKNCSLQCNNSSYVFA